MLYILLGVLGASHPEYPYIEVRRYSSYSLVFLLFLFKIPEAFYKECIYYYFLFFIFVPKGPFDTEKYWEAHYVKHAFPQASAARRVAEMWLEGKIKLVIEYGLTPEEAQLEWDDIP